jgi:hypothetical protein
MTDTREQHPGGELAFSVAAVDEWVMHVESVLRGITHALNNRASAMSAVIELAGEHDEASAVRSILGSELERLLELATVVRSVGTPRAGGSEAFAPSDVVPEATAVLRLHADQRDRVILIDANGAPPTRLPRWMFLRALVALAATAAPAMDRATAVRLTVEGDGDWVLVRCDQPSAPRSTYACELASAMGGGPVEGQCGFRVPTLAAIRRREAR